MVNSFTGTALWGGLLDDPEVAAVFSADAMLSRLVAFERAWTTGLAAVGAVSDDTTRAALAALDGFTPDLADLEAGAARDGLPVPELVRQLRAQSTPEGHGALHVGATSQDVIDTAMVLAALDLLDMLRARLDGIVAMLDRLDAAYGATEMMGRTRMQAALPIPVGHRIAGWRAPLADLLDAAEPLRETLCAVQIGGPVGLRDGQPEALAEQVAMALGLRAVPVWHTNRTRMVDLGHWLAKLAGALGKMGQDLALMAQQGVDEMRLSGAGGSSAMPHKRNPVRAELLVALARSAAGLQGTLLQAMVHEQERSGAAWAVEWLTLPALFETAGAGTRNAAALLDQITDLGEGAAAP